MSNTNLGYHYLQSAKEAHAMGNLVLAKENATRAAGYLSNCPERIFEYLDCITLLQTLASLSGNLEEYQSLEPLVKSTIYKIFGIQAPFYYALHQYDSSELYMNKGMLTEAKLLIEEAHQSLSQSYADNPAILYQYHYFLSRYLYRCEDYYSCIDSCLTTNELWMALEETESEDHEDPFLSMLYQNMYQITRMGILNAILLASSYGKLNNSETGIQILQNILQIIPSPEDLDYYIRSAIDLNLAELYARNHNFPEALRLMEPYQYADYSNYPDLAACVDTIHFAVAYSTGFQKDLPLRLSWITNLSDTISNDYLKLHCFNLAVALASQGQYEESLALSKGIGDKGLSLRMALYHELSDYAGMQKDFSRVCSYYLKEIEHIFSHYKEELVYNHLNALEYHISLCLGALLSEELKKSNACLPSDQLYEFYLNTKGISLEGSYLLRQYPDIKALKHRSLIRVMDLQRQIPKDVILLEYVLSRTLNEAYYDIFIVSHEQVDYLRLGTEGEIKELLQKYQDYLQDFSGAPLTEPEISDLKSKLRRKLILPIKKYLSNINGLIMAPVGDLYYIPFEALTIDSTTELGDLYQITYLNIGRELAITSPTQSDSDSILSHSLILGNPHVYRLPDLPFAALETESAGELLQARVYHGREASIDLLYRSNLQIPLLHIAAHGFFRNTVYLDSTQPTTSDINSNPMKTCGLFLADEYPLTADEISSLPLSEVKLCILSACYSGLGEGRGNEGIFGLRRGFFLAGCRSLLLSLWSIHDFAGMLFIRIFYECLITMQLDTYQALKNTKQIMRTRTVLEWKHYWQELLMTTTSLELSEAVQAYSFQNDEYIPFEHPYYWAGFQLIGKPVSLL